MTATYNIISADVGNAMDHLATSGGGLVATSGGGVPRSGTYALRAATAGTQRWSEFGGWNATGRPANLGLTTQVYAGFYYKPSASHPNGSCIIASARDSSGNVICQVLTDASGNITLQGTGAASGTIATVSTGSYTQLILRVNSNGTCGLTVAGGAETTVTGGNFTFDRLRLGIQTTSITADCYWDDAYLGDFPMSSWVARLAAARAAGSGSNWQSGSGNTFAVVDDVPHNSDTDYLESLNGTGSNSPRTFLVTSTTTLGITDPIVGVLAIAVVRENGASANLYRTVVNHGVATVIASSTAADIGTTSYIPIGFIMDTDPDTAAAWTYGGFDATEFGVEKSGSAAGALRCTAIYAAVLSGVVVTSTTISPTGIASLEDFGTLQINSVIAPTGIASLESIGTAKVNSILLPSGIASLESFGTAVIAPGAVTILPSGIASLEDFGSLTAINVQIVSLTGIASLEDFGVLTITPGPFTILPSGIASLEAFGTLAVGSIISPTGIASLEDFGVLQVNSALTLAGIASLESFGTAVLAATISPSGIVSLEAFGALIAKNVVIILPTGIASLEAFGTATLRATIAPTGIASLEAFGTAVILRIVSPTGIASLEAFGALSIAAGAVTIQPVGIVSAEAFGALVALLSVTDGAKPPPGFSVLTLPMGSGASPFNPIPPAGGSGASLWLPPGVGR